MYAGYMMRLAIRRRDVIITCVTVAVTYLTLSFFSLNKIHLTQNQSKQLQNNDIKIASTQTLDRTYDFNLTYFQEHVTILIYKNKYSNADCFTEQIKQVSNAFPNIKIIASSYSSTEVEKKLEQFLISKSGILTEGAALNKMLSMVTTKYFLYLSDGATLSKFKSDNGPGWLLHTLESIPEVDFVGGAYVRYNSSLRYKQYEIQCYRMKMCKWVFYETYEYEYSIGDMMICEETSTSFLGRTASMSKVGQFDETLDDMVTTEFFWRAKKSAIIGLRPEVFFLVSKACSQLKQLSLKETSLNKQAFMDKYDLTRIQDSYGRITNYPRNPKRNEKTQRIWQKFTYNKDGGVMSPQYYETMVKLLYLVDDFFHDHKDLVYFLDGGVPLGGIKMRAILPWDGAADIDTGYYGIKWTQLLRNLKELCKNCSFVTGINSFGPEGLKHIEIRLPAPYSNTPYNELYTHEFEEKPAAEDMLYITVNGRDIPVERTFIKEHRKLYGINYLQTLNKERQHVECKVQGHHACLPDVIRNGGGYWNYDQC